MSKGEYMGYTDKDLMVSTQIAYYDVPEEDYKKANCSIGQRIKQDRETRAGTYQYVVDKMNEAEREKGKDSLEYKRFHETKKMYDSIADGTGEYGEYGNWKIVNVKDDNKNSGFYGCVIDTGNGEAIVGYRGSESTDAYQIKKDWGDADIRLLNSISTEQQEVGRKYLEEVMRNPTLQYKKYTGTGHSLGDNLITDAYLHLPKKYRDKMNVYGFDGPGFSNEYISELEKYYKEHGWNLEESTHKITHYQWSLVGAIFGRSLRGVNFLTVQTTDDVYGKTDLQSLTQKHAVIDLKFDEEGNLILGEMDPLAVAIYVLTQGIDDATHTDTEILSNIIVAVLCANDAEKIALGVMAVALITSYGVGTSIAAILTIISSFLLVGGLDELWNEYLKDELIKIRHGIYEDINNLVTYIKQIVKKALNKIKQTPQFINEMLKDIEYVFQKFVDWVYRQSAGFQYATVNPYIILNTTQMHTYAGQLQSISARAKRLDERINHLYLTLGIDWNPIYNLANLMKAGVLLDYSYRLDCCSKYIEQTAEDFENVERRLASL